MLDFKQWNKRRKKKESHYERPTSQTDREIRHQADQGQADRSTPQKPSEGLPILPIVR